MSLSVLCITENAEHAEPFIEQLADDAALLGAELVVFDGSDAQVIEQVLDDAIAQCAGDYILRVDDDETLTVQLVEWLRAGHYLQADHWAFPRRNLWPDGQSFIINPPLWPDLQTRLSVKAKAGGRQAVHDGSPYGTGQIAPDRCFMDHHKFLCRSRDEREALVRRYDEQRPGAGSEYIMFSLPELYDGELAIEAIA